MKNIYLLNWIQQINKQFIRHENNKILENIMLLIDSSFQPLKHIITGAVKTALENSNIIFLLYFALGFLAIFIMVSS